MLVIVTNTLVRLATARHEGFPPWVIARVGIAGALHDAKFAFRFQATFKLFQTNIILTAAVHDAKFGFQFQALVFGQRTATFDSS